METDFMSLPSHLIDPVPFYRSFLMHSNILLSTSAVYLSDRILTNISTCYFAFVHVIFEQVFLLFFWFSFFILERLKHSRKQKMFKRELISINRKKLVQRKR